MKAKTERVSRPMLIGEIIESVLADFGPRRFGPEYSALVFTRNSIGILELKMVRVTNETAVCERCRKAPPETREHLCLSCSKEVFGA